MKKLGLLLVMSSCMAYGMSYTKLKQYALKHSNILKSQTVSLQTIQQKNSILLRSKNPVLDLEASRYDPDLSSSKYGYSITASQTVRTQTYMNGLHSKTEADNLLQSALVKQKKATYIKTLEKYYTEYVYQNKLLAVLQSEYKLGNKIVTIVKERYMGGSENKVSYLRAKTEVLALKTHISTTKQQINTLYYQLLAMAGVHKKVSLQKRFIYDVSTQTRQFSKPLPQQKILQANKKQFESQLKMHQSSFQSYDLYAGIEKEPDQSIVRLGISLALPLHHDRSQERTLAKLKMQQLKLDTAQLSLDISSQKKILKASVKELGMQYHTLKTLKKEQQVLTTLLKEGYKIDQSSLFELMSTKNKLLQTQKALLQTQKMINDQKIELLFLQGHYND